MSVDSNLNNLGNAKPQLAGEHDGSHISGANAGAKGTKGTMGGSMRVSSYQYHPRPYYSRFWHHLVTYTGVNIKQVTYTLLADKLAHLLLVIGRLHCRRRCIMVKNESYALRILDLLASNFEERPDCL